MLCFGYIIRTKCPFLMPYDAIYAADTLHNIYIPKMIRARLATALNSTITMLMVEYAGRANLSGIVQLKRYETAHMQIPNPFGLTPAPLEALMAANHALVARDRRTESGFRLTLTDTRRAIDAPVFEWLGLTQAEQYAVYNAVYDAIVKRQTAEGNIT